MWFIIWQNHTHTHTQTCIYIYIYIERERERENLCECVSEREGEKGFFYYFILSLNENLWTSECVFTQHLCWSQGVTQGQFSSGVKLVLFPSLIFFFDKLPNQGQKPSLLYYLPIAVEISDGFMPFKRALVRNKMHWTWARILTLLIDTSSLEEMLNSFHKKKKKIQFIQ